MVNKILEILRGLNILELVEGDMKKNKLSVYKKYFNII